MNIKKIIRSRRRQPHPLPNREGSVFPLSLGEGAGGEVKQVIAE